MAREAANNRNAHAPAACCVVPPELVDGLAGPLRELGESRPRLRVVAERRNVDRRRRDRRGGGDARPSAAHHARERRTPLHPDGRRVAERRAETRTVPVPPEALPPGLRDHAHLLKFVSRPRRSRREREHEEAARLVASFQEGRAEAFDALYRMYFPQLRQMLRSVLRDPYEAEDLAQDVLLDVLGALPRFSLDGPPFRTWLMTLARNRMISSMSTRRRAAVADPAEVERDLDRHAPDDELAQLEWMADDEFVELIRWLPPPQRQVLLLRYRFDLAWEEIGHVLGRSSGAVRVLQTRAFELLRPQLQAGLRPAARH